MRVSPYRRGKALTFVYTQERPDLSRELPNWMFDQAYCAGMSLGSPQVSIEGLAELAAVLASWTTNRRHGARSRPSQKEIGHAKIPPPLPGPARLALEPRKAQPPVAPTLKGIVEALAELLLDAAQAERPTRQGGSHERPDHH